MLTASGRCRRRILRTAGAVTATDFPAKCPPDRRRLSLRRNAHHVVSCFLLLCSCCSRAHCSQAPPAAPKVKSRAKGYRKVVLPPRMNSPSSPPNPIQCTPATIFESTARRITLHARFPRGGVPSTPAARFTLRRSPQALPPALQLAPLHRWPLPGAAQVRASALILQRVPPRRTPVPPAQNHPRWRRDCATLAGTPGFHVEAGGARVARSWQTVRFAIRSKPRRRST